jgi:hypothetical protein
MRLGEASMITRGLTAILATVMAAVLLAGCASAPAPPPPKPTSAELERLVITNFKGTWVRLTDKPPPAALDDVHIVSFVSATDWPAMMSECTKELGVTGISYFPEYSWGWTYATEAYHRTQAYAYTVCSIKYPRLELKSQLRTRVELGYLYDYYRNVAIPCIRSFGLKPLVVFDRESFLLKSSRGIAAWSPFDALPVDKNSGEGKALELKCPALPPGF